LSNTLFIADLHYGHNGISEKFRKNFESDEAHDAFIHDRILSTSGKRNDLWVLGDVVFKPEKFHMVGDFAKYFRNVHIVLGNHDHKMLPAYCVDNGINVYGLTKRYKWWLSHCPIHPGEMYRALGNVHGHLHSNKVQTLEYDKVVDDPRYFCVSCEQVEYKPISLEEIRERTNWEHLND